jgi:hypothetical protein
MNDPLPTSLGSFAFVPWLRRGAVRYLGAEATAQSPVSVTLQVGANAVTSPALALRGPGDVVGFDPAAVCRIWPANATTGVEPEFLALIEFDQPDLPWRYTPAAAAGDQLSPWLCLIVATDGEYASPIPGTADRPLGSVTITSAAALPDLAHSFAWAHAEVIGETTVDGALAASLTRTSPQLIRSRILCPRALTPNTAYRAFLVPTTELGRLSGLMTPAANTPVTATAWGSPPVTLPVYYQWAFSTGEAGDFSDLVRQLTANPLPDSVAWRDMDVGDVSGGVAPIGMESALTTADHPSKDLPAADQVRVAARYASALAPTPPEVRPPLYGSAYIPTSGRPAWYADLNNDPRTRAAAGLGAQVVRQHADALLAGAWSQAEGLREANQQLKQWELSRELARSLWSRHAPAHSADSFLSFIAPIAARIRNGAVTVTQAVTVSTLAPGSLSAALRRLSRPGGAVVLRQGRQAAPSLMSRMSSGAWLGSDAVLAPPTNTTRGLSPVRIGSTAISTQRLGNVATLFGASDPVATLKATNDTTGLAAAATTLVQQLVSAPKPGLVLTALNLPVFQKEVAGEVDPAAAIDVEVHSRTLRSDGRNGAAPFVVAPSFPQAMSQWLAALSQEWLLAGLGEVPAHTVSLLAANQRFLEAFMTGLNDEMGRRLIFDEYPTDVRATFFKSFWQYGREDIASLDTWGALGNNPSPGGFGGDPLVLLIRGAIVRRYPNMQVFAVQATQAGPQRTLGGTETPILFSGRMDPDVAFYGFPLTKDQALGTATTPGYYFVIQEHPCEPRFGGTLPGGSSAAVAAALLQHPVRLAIYAADLLSASTLGET